jgi:hypothetical protein
MQARTLRSDLGNRAAGSLPILAHHSGPDCGSLTSIQRSSRSACGGTHHHFTRAHHGRGIHHDRAPTMVPALSMQQSDLNVHLCGSLVRRRLMSSDRLTGSSIL